MKTPVSGGGCLLSSGTWVNSPLAQIQTSTFRIGFDATPANSLVDAVTGISAGIARGYQDLAAIVRFNAEGMVDARNGSTYTAATPIPYSAGVTYHFILDINVTTHTYDAYVVTGTMQSTIGSHLAFRTEQATLSSLTILVP